jgi:Arginine degradation protein (predicted deacylase)
MHNPMEKTNIKNRIKEITFRLTNVLSVSETPGEIEVSKEIYTILSEMDYFKNNPDDLFLQDISTDRHGRKNVIAMLRGQKNPEKKKPLY